MMKERIATGLTALALLVGVAGCDDFAELNNDHLGEKLRTERRAISGGARRLLENDEPNSQIAAEKPMFYKEFEKDFEESIEVALKEGIPRPFQETLAKLMKKKDAPYWVNELNIEFINTTRKDSPLKIIFCDEEYLAVFNGRGFLLRRNKTPYKYRMNYFVMDNLANAPSDSILNFSLRER